MPANMNRITEIFMRGKLVVRHSCLVACPTSLQSCLDKYVLPSRVVTSIFTNEFLHKHKNNFEDFSFWDHRIQYFQNVDLKMLYLYNKYSLSQYTNPNT